MPLLVGLVSTLFRTDVDAGAPAAGLVPGFAGIDSLVPATPGGHGERGARGVQVNRHLRGWDCATPFHVEPSRARTAC
ncbi:hypothetical protein SAMN05216207_103323 [Pseudonocardia ammonioxydans]|uniref:Uncharacterized protein n=1 Tax=Pseudonocardia ammonioxydans TaxID=260086 RepID=A0A1I5EWF2_PSUAM|nr:hypothetical protein [Pseudonocardia ammonioxydans]SFO15361.1 hypothetical protein SAMN05216207_103323 [Pseudonocardia ammonioxydans]